MNRLVQFVLIPVVVGMLVTGESVLTGALNLPNADQTVAALR